MNRRIKLLGLPLYPMLIVYPLGLWPTAVILDLIVMSNGNRALSIASYWMNVAGHDS